MEGPLGPPVNLWYNHLGRLATLDEQSGMFLFEVLDTFLISFLILKV